MTLAAAADTGDAPIAGEEITGGMPQLDASTYASQVFWLIVTFGLLYWLFSKRGLPRVAGVLEQREKRIAGDLERAAELRSQAEEAMQRYEAHLADAQAQARAAIKQAHDRLHVEVAAREAELEQRLQAQIAEADRRIAAARDEALTALESVANEISRAAVQRLIGVEVSEGDAAAAVAAARQEAA
ncbi:MAG: F0F1 ATP synthase subunit B' [Pseudomonadota bacterium]